MHNEEEGINQFAADLIGYCKDLPFERCRIIWVNDGSTDTTEEKLRQLISADTSVVHSLINFSRNFGHEAAMIAGVDHSDADVLVCMDSDGQHPPEVLEKLCEEYFAGADVVLTERTKRKDASALMNALSGVFYIILNKLADMEFERNSSDFFLVSKKVSNLLRSEFREQNRFIRGFIQSVGFKRSVVQFEAPQREFGESKYSLVGLMRLSFNALFSFSNKPLRLTIAISATFIFFTLIVMVYTLFVFFFKEKPPSGYTTIVLLIGSSFSLLFVSLTVLSLYFERALREIRSRPLYIIDTIEESTSTVD